MAVTASTVQSQIRILGLVSAGHFMAHFYGMALPPLFPFLHQDLGISYTLLGLLLSIKSITSGTTQLPAGVLVDRFGAKLILCIGLLLCATGIGLMGFANSFWVLGGLILVVGVGNSVFHPADYTILNSTMNSSYMGRSFSVHTFSGHLGTALAPAVVLTITALWNWRVALILSGIVGILVLLVLGTQWRLLHDDVLSTKPRKNKKAITDSEDEASQSTWQFILKILSSKPILYLFIFFAISSLAGGGLRNFAVAGLVALHGTPVAAAGGALSGFLFASALGVLAGGFVADKTNRHDVVAGVALLTAAGIVFLIGSVDLHYTVVVFVFSFAGLINGIVRPARDMMIRNASPQGSMGKVFGFVSSGHSIGGGIAPILYGMLIDFGRPEWIFYTSAIFFILCMIVVLLSGHATRKLQS